MKKKILITGATGFIGSHLTELLINDHLVVSIAGKIFIMIMVG